MKLLLTTLLVIFGLGSLGNAALTVAVGDCWSYVTRPGEEASFLVIRKIENSPETGEVVIISVFGLKFKNGPGVYQDNLPILAIEGGNLRRSLKEKIQKDIPEQDWQGAYRLWKNFKPEIMDQRLEGRIHKGTVSQAISTEEPKS